MYSVHGWIAFAESPVDVDLRELEKRVAEVRSYLDDWTVRSIRTDLFNTNGLDQLTLSCNANRRRPGDVNGMKGLLDLIDRRLPGSWGLIYERDNETTEPPGPNAYKVTVIVRGRGVVQDDPFFSPVIPVLEDPFGFEDDE